MGARNPRTNLIVHHGIADIFDQAAEFIHILGAIQETCDLASLCQRDKVLKDIVEFPGRVHVRLSIDLGEGELLFEGRPPLFLPNLTLGSRRTQRSC